MYIFLNTAHTFSLLQYQTSACTPHILHYTDIAQVSMPKYECSLARFRVYLSVLFCESIQIQYYFAEKLHDQFQEKNACYLSLIHSIKICNNIFRHFIYVSAFKIPQNLCLKFLIAFLYKQEKLRLM